MICSARLLNALGLVALIATTDTFAIDRVYHPYVEPFEREIEYRVTGFNDGDDRADVQMHRFGFGYGVSDHLAVDAYILGAQQGGDALKVEAYELELLWQLNEQGADWLDAALQFELEHADEENSDELSVGFIAEKEIARHWSATANFIAHYETGDDISDEFEAEMATQLRYRLNQRFEPALELYWNEDVIAAGPAALGTLPLGGRNRVQWEAAALLTAEHELARRIFRFALEWEF